MDDKKTDDKTSETKDDKTSEEKKEKTPEEKKESKALQVRIQQQVSTLSDEDQMLFKIYANENQGARMGIPEIRINYDEDSGVKGAFVVIDYDELDDAGNPKKGITFVDTETEIEVTIMRTRFKFGYFDDAKGEKGMELYGTPEMDDYTGEVNLWDNEQKRIIFSGQYKAFKNYINETYPDPRLEQKGYSGSIIKHTEILYVEYKEKVYRMYLSKTARDNYWLYKEEIRGVPTFAFKTKLSTSKEKSGSIVYFPIHFEKTEDNEIKKYISLRKKLDADLKIFDSIRENLKGEVDSDTVKGEDPEVIITKKYKLNFKKDFENPACPVCTAPTVLRDSFKGPFFGCTKFPDCKGIVGLEGLIEKSVDSVSKTDEINVDDIPF